MFRYLKTAIEHLVENNVYKSRIQTGIINQYDG